MQVTLDELHMSGWTDKVYCVQYHEVVQELCGPWLGALSWLANVLALLGLAVAQVIACSNNMYRLSSACNKRYATVSEPGTSPHALAVTPAR